MLPLGTMGRTKFRPYMTFTLIVINFVVFALQLVVLAQGEPAIIKFLGQYALAACSIETAPLPLTLRNAIFTMFLHGSLPHVFFNMVYLWIFGPRVEMFFGHRRFLVFYLVVGLLASLAHVLFGGVACPAPAFGADILIGASGAIAGVMGAFLFLYPGARVRTAILFREIRLPALIYLGIWVGMDILRIWQAEPTNIAHWAHVGGFFAGMGILFIVTLFVPAPAGNPLEHLDD